MKLRVGDPWMPASEYSKTLKGLTINILVKEIEPALSFAREVLSAEVVYSDPDFAVLSAYDAEWMLHADHTYDKHPMGDILANGAARGTGTEFRLHGCDPDAAEEAARAGGYEVLSSATDKGHGVREAFIRDQDGYIWVPDVLLSEA
jgi:catechol 2,3-dioxygenase-like lactoylglutathione lyase family enzyme